jgi:alpha-tubulin suppressor-like RCC1 family protein
MNACSTVRSACLILPCLATATHAQSGSTVFAYGANEHGQCEARQVVVGAVQVSAGDHSVAMRADGSIVAWGLNDSGQCNVPVNLGPVAFIGTGLNHTLAGMRDGTVRAWGQNTDGQCNVPPGLNDAIQVEGGWKQSAALRKNGTVIAWGSNQFNMSTVPQGLVGVTQISLRWAHGVALKNDGTVAGWGSNFAGEGTVPTGLSGVKQISAGAYHNIVLTAGDRVRCWGAGTTDTGEYYEFGQSIVPADAAFAVAVAAGYEHSVALLKNGSIRIWGAVEARSGYGCGVGGPDDDCDGPLQSRVTSIFAGCHHTLGIKAAPASLGGVIPSAGSAAGGVEVTITGENFLPSSQVFFDDVAAESVTWISPTRLTARTPSKRAGAVAGFVTVRVDNASAPDAFYGLSDCPNDLDGDGSVGNSDVSLLLLDYGNCARGQPE